MHGSHSRDGGEGFEQQALTPNTEQGNWRDHLDSKQNDYTGQLEWKVTPRARNRSRNLRTLSQDRPQREDTQGFGFSHRITEDWSFYFLRSQGIAPNTGMRDGAYQAIDAEKTTNHEIGVKFDLWEGQVSGTISAGNRPARRIRNPLNQARDLTVFQSCQFQFCGHIADI